MVSDSVRRERRGGGGGGMAFGGGMSISSTSERSPGVPATLPSSAESEPFEPRPSRGASTRSPVVGVSGGRDLRGGGAGGEAQGCAAAACYGVLAAKTKAAAAAQ